MKRIAISLAALALVLTTVPAPAAASDRLLSLIPPDASAVGMIRLDDIRGGSLGSRLFDDLDRSGTSGDLSRFLEEAGLQPGDDLDVVAFASVPRGLSGESDFLVLASGRFHPERLSQALASRGGTMKNSAGASYWVPEEDEHRPGHSPAVWFASSHLTVAGTEPAVLRAMAASSAGGTDFLAASPLAHDLRLVDPLAAGWLLVDVQRSARLVTRRPDLPENAPFNAAAIAASMKKVSTIAVWAREDQTQVVFGATAVSADSETVDLLADVLRGVTAAWRMAAQEKNPELVKVIRRFNVTTRGDAVILTGSIPSDVVRRTAARHSARR